MGTKLDNGDDYANLAINPYAISTDDLRMVDLNKKNSGPMDNSGFADEHNQYEDTLEVAKKAGLEGAVAGRRKKENIIYEDATVNNNKSKAKKNTGPRLRNSALPPRPASADTEWQGISKKRSTQWRIPFTILLILVIIAIVGGALGVLAYFDANDSCSCTSSPITSASTGPNNSESNAKLISQLTEELDELRKELDALKTKQNTQDNVDETLSNTMQQINSTFNSKLATVNSDVSLLAREIYELGNSLQIVGNFTQELSSTLDTFNSTFSIKLTNVSKEMGPRGFNGSQGPQGIQGIGNLSLCTVQGDDKKQKYTAQTASDTKAQVSVTERTGYKILGATCTTEEHYGAGQFALSVTEPSSGTHPYTYRCTCVGVSSLGSLQPVNDPDDGLLYIKCVIKYWECPLLTGKTAGTTAR